VAVQKNVKQDTFNPVTPMGRVTLFILKVNSVTSCIDKLPTTLTSFHISIANTVYIAVFAA
jgi:hypothetical protein